MFMATSGTAGLPSYSFIPPNLEEKLLRHYLSQQTKDTSLFSKLIRQQMSIGVLKALRDLRTTSEYRAAKKISPIAPGTPSPIEIWDYSRTPPKLVISSTGTFGPDAAAKTCFDNMKRVDVFSSTIFQRYPVDNSTKLMRAYTHFDGAFNNAYWHPVTETVYFGEVDPNIFNPLVLNQDVTTHELGHAVTQYTADFEYMYQSGALNESMSDVFAIQMKHHLNSTPANTANWFIGDGLIVNDKKSGALRSMQDPGSAFDHPILGQDPQPKHMRDFYITSIGDDNGGVHTNSGIPNHAFFLTAMNIGGNSWERPGKIWYEALNHSQRQDDFSAFAGRTIQAAKDLQYPEGIQNIVNKAWFDVGVDLRRKSKQAKTAPDYRLAVGLMVGGSFLLGFCVGSFLGVNSVKTDS